MDALGYPLANRNAVSPASGGPTAPLQGSAVPEAPEIPSDAPAASESFAGIVPIRILPGRPVGYAKTGGRRKGTKNRRTIEVEEALRPLVPRAKRKLRELIGSDDPRTAFSACMAVLSYVFGRPIDRAQVGGLPGSQPIEVSTATKLPSDAETLRLLALILTDSPADPATQAIIGSLGSERTPIIDLDPDAADEAHEGAVASPDAPPSDAVSRPVDAEPLASGVDRSDSHGQNTEAPVGALSKSATTVCGAPHTDEKKSPEISPKKSGLPEPKVGQVALIDCYRIHNNGPQREGLCDSFSILDDDGAFMTSAISGFAGAISWCHARGVDPDTEVTIVTPPPPADLPQIDQIRAGQPRQK